MTADYLHRFADHQLPGCFAQRGIAATSGVLPSLIFGSFLLASFRVMTCSWNTPMAPVFERRVTPSASLFVHAQARRKLEVFKEILIRVLIVLGLIAIALVRAFNNILRRS